MERNSLRLARVTLEQDFAEEHIPEQNFHLVCRPQHEWQATHNQFAAENYTWLAAAVDEDAQSFDCCSTVVGAAVVAVERHVDFAAGLHPATQVVVVRFLGG